jgi:hypothetical protein
VGPIESHNHEVAEYHTHTHVVVAFETPARGARQACREARRSDRPVGIFSNNAGRSSRSV